MKELIKDNELCQISIEAQRNAYAPYSNFKVGAALLCKDGSIYSGCNIENATYGATLCAERCAISKAVSDGKTEFLKIAITSSKEEYTMPCGICRQVMYEFMKDGSVLVFNGTDIKEYSVKDLIPGCFEL